VKKIEAPNSIVGFLLCWGGISRPMGLLRFHATGFRHPRRTAAAKRFKVRPR
jgi:hypothetical protein